MPARMVAGHPLGMVRRRRLALAWHARRNLKYKNEFWIFVLPPSYSHQTMPWDPDGLFSKYDYRLLQMQQWRAQNKARQAELCRRWQAKNPDRVLELNRRWRQENREHLRQWHAANKDRRNARRNAARAQDPEKYRAPERQRNAGGSKAARQAARRAGLNKATPPWVDRAELRRIYEFAADMGRQVDHIHPLKGKNFCGLHVPWNLQLLTATENATKGNRLPELFFTIGNRFSRNGASDA